MKLSELSEEYKASAAACRSRAEELRKLLESAELCETEKLKLRRRIYTLSIMAREAAATGKYLKHYYKGENA